MPDMLPFWSDDFDMDLLKVFPDVANWCHVIADRKLWTHSRPTGGRINCPSSWNTHDGLTAFFWTRPPLHAIKSIVHGDSRDWFRFGGGYTTDAPLLECTWLEVLRDEWVHQQVVNVDGRVVWRPEHLWPDFSAVMWFVRDRTKVRDASVEQVQSALKEATPEIAERLLRCRRSIEQACARFDEVVKESRDG